MGSILSTIDSTAARILYRSRCNGSGHDLIRLLIAPNPMLPRMLLQRPSKPRCAHISSKAFTSRRSTHLTSPIRTMIASTARYPL
eukprot:6206489-Pleurochrysis_carterae.AAC.3